MLIQEQMIATETSHIMYFSFITLHSQCKYHAPEY